MLWWLVWGCAPEPEPPSPPPEPVPDVAPVPIDEAHTVYTLGFDEAAHHLIDVTATVPHDGSEALVWMMPVWTPGSYLVREYAQHVEGVEATGASGRPLAVTKVAKNRWSVAAAGEDGVRLSWRAYGREASVRTNWIAPELAVIVGAATFLVPVDALDRPSRVELPDPLPYDGCYTALDETGSGHRLAGGYDELVDSPIVCGPADVRRWRVRGVDHELVTIGDDFGWDHPRAAEAVQAISEEIVRFWGDVPYSHYSFLNVLGLGGGGLEHLDNTLMFARVPGDDDAWRRWYGLVSHEFFHTWNVKRLRPVGLGPFDYEREVHTESLWVAEGVTSYFDDLLLVRAGLMTGPQHLERLSDMIGALQRKPGRHLQPLSQASYDAWIEFYRRDEHSPNVAVSYYRKGALVAWLLDAAVRRATADRKTLDDVLRTLDARFREDGYTPDDVRAVASEVAGLDLDPFFDAYVDGTDELDYGPALSWWGLRFAPADDTPTPWLGVDASGPRFTVDAVRRGTPAWDAGLTVGDELLALGDRRVEAGTWQPLIEHHAVGDTVSLLVARRGLLTRMEATVASAPGERWRLELDPGAGTGTALRRRRWWGR